MQQLLLDGSDAEALRRAGVGWVVSEQGTPGVTRNSATTVRQLPVVYRDGDLILYRVGGTTPGASDRARAIAIAAHLVWAALLLGSLTVLAVNPRAYSGGWPYRRR